MKSSAALTQATYDARANMFKVLAPGTLLVVDSQGATAVLVERIDGAWRTLHTTDMHGATHCTYNDFYKGTPLLFVSRINNTELPYIVVLAEEKLWRIFCHSVVLADEVVANEHLSRENK
ncbi:MAG: hypothetical protein WC761_00095 [Candidatus Paceibacterota bacterium]|jgi:hypothetical protein